MRDIDWEYGVTANMYDCEQWFSLEDVYQGIKVRLEEESRQDGGERPVSPRLTNAQCDAIAEVLDAWAHRKGCENGLPLWDDESVSHARALIREAITNPSRPDAGNTQE